MFSITNDMVLCNRRAAQQINGREGETATLLSRCLFNSKLRVFGFAPRHLSRYVHSLNLCEVFYHARRKGTEKEAKQFIDELLELGFIERNDLEIEFWQEAGNLKAIHKKVSLADCCAIALAKKLDATLITSDHHEMDTLAQQGVCKISFFR